MVLRHKCVCCVPGVCERVCVGACERWRVCWSDVEAHCYVVDIGHTDCEQICSRINNDSATYLLTINLPNMFSLYCPPTYGSPASPQCQHPSNECRECRQVRSYTPLTPPPPQLKLWKVIKRQFLGDRSWLVAQRLTLLTTSLRSMGSVLTGCNSFAQKGISGWQNVISWQANNWLQRERPRTLSGSVKLPSSRVCNNQANQLV